MKSSLLLSYSDRILSDWKQLYKSAENPHFFQSPEWVLSWVQQKGHQKRLKFLAHYEGQDLAALIPLTQSGVWLRPAAAGPSDYLSPLAINNSGFQPITNQMLEVAKHQPFLLPRQLQPITQHIDAEHLKVTQYQEDQSYQVQFIGNYQSYLEGLSKSLRYDLKKAEKCEALQIKNYRGLKSLEVLDLFVDLHRARWRSRKQPGAFTNSRFQFHKRAISQGLDAEINVAYFHQVPISAIYVLYSGKTAYFYQSGTLPAKLSPCPSVSCGSALIANAIHRTSEEGLSTFDFMRGCEPYKMRWKPNQTTSIYTVLMTPRSRLGELSEFISLRALYAEKLIRNRLEGTATALQAVTTIYL